jgi:O-antigen/teichoic acid export membrane protein
MKGDIVAGWYNAACNLIVVLVSIASAFIYAVFPAMSRFFISDRDSLRIALEKSSKYLFIVGLPVAVGTILLADRIILLIYEVEFAAAAVALRILSLYLPLRFISHATGWTLASINREPLRTLSAGIAAGVNIGLNLLFIPRLGLVGAGIATVVTQTFLFTLYFYFVAKHFHRLLLHKVVIKPCAACLVMGIFIFLLRDINLFLLIALAGMTYFGILYLLKTFDADDKKIFNDVVRGPASRLPHRQMEA